MVVLYGKSCSGKDSIGLELEKLGYERLVTYTTRPMRKGEINGKNYHFIPKWLFIFYILTGRFLEYKKYKTKTDKGKDTTWYYGSMKRDYLNAKWNTYAILDPVGVRIVYSSNEIKSRMFYIKANDYTIRHRLKTRGDNKLEAERRFNTDQEDFYGMEKFANHSFWNNLSSFNNEHYEDEDRLKQIAKEINEYLDGIIYV